jgi:large subunit ribosomal protein L9
MKVILLQNVPKVGKKYELVEVAPGYARNFLVARGLGEIITRVNVGRVEELQKRRSLEAAKESARLEKALATLAATKLSFAREANEEGHLYAQITMHDVAEAIEKATEVAIPAAQIHAAHQIKSVGEHQVKVQVGEKTVEITLDVTAVAA